jgi:SAM-dependent methyltransferase
VAALRRSLDVGGPAELVVPHPDLAGDRGLAPYPGERFEVDGRALRHRPLRLWTDLAERLGCRLRLPAPEPPHHVRLVIEPLGAEAPWQRSDDADKYGAAGPFQRLERLEEPTLLLDLLDALAFADPPADARVLSLGVNAGHELDLLAIHAPERADRHRIVGLDLSASALALARARHPADRHRFLNADVADLDRLDLGRFDLVLALALLQSPAVDDRTLIRTLVQHHLNPGGSIILSLPNAHYRGGDLLVGARTRNYREPELGLLIKDLAFYRRYLHQHRFRVRVMGKGEVVVVGKGG